MKSVLITGSEGFIGKNLHASLRSRSDMHLVSFDLHDEPGNLESLLDKADYIFHLAGINRPKDPTEFENGNRGLTERICAHLSRTGKKTPIALASSTQAELDNPYGESKRGAEDAVFCYRAVSGADVHVFRFPNVFGKWCRPNYNSAVATFCHNIAHGLPFQVNDPSVTMRLVYIDDVVRTLSGLLDGKVSMSGDFCVVNPVHEIQLGEIVRFVLSFKDSREQRTVPDMGDPFVKKLYATYLSYLPVGEFSYPLTMHSDERGSFTEFIKTVDRGQVSVNISKPGITKGNHWHHTKNEKFLVVSGQGIIRLRRIGSDKIIEYAVSGDNLVVIDIPVGYTHNISNTGSSELVTVMWCNESYDPDYPDTIFESVEYNT